MKDCQGKTSVIGEAKTEMGQKDKEGGFEVRAGVVMIVVVLACRSCNRAATQEVDSTATSIPRRVLCQQEATWGFTYDIPLIFHISRPRDKTIKIMSYDGALRICSKQKGGILF